MTEFSPLKAVEVPVQWNVVRLQQGGKMTGVTLIGAGLGIGAQRIDTADGPTALATHEMQAYPWGPMLHQPKGAGATQGFAQRLPIVADFNQTLSDETYNCVAAEQFPIVIGGDHAIAIGTWPGVVAAKSAQKNFGLIWVDAHMDANTPETSPSQAIHGMPLASLLGYGDPALVDCHFPGATLAPEHVVLIGIRSFESGEAALLKQLGVTIYGMADIKQLGLSTIMQKACEQVSHDTLSFGVTIDLDAMDPADAPGVGSPEPDGLSGADLIAALPAVTAHANCCALEIAEYNPVRDEHNKTATLVKALVDATLSSR